MALATQRVLNRSTLVLLERLNKPLVTLASIAATIVLKCDSLYFVRFLVILIILKKCRSFSGLMLSNTEKCVRSGASGVVSLTLCRDAGYAWGFAQV